MPITRNLESTLIDTAKKFPALTVTGPRQSGKSTICAKCFPFLPRANLELTDVRSFATSDPRGFLSQFPNGAFFDEVQRAPDLLSYLQEIIDNDPTPGRWVLSGSQHFGLIDAVSQSLAGRSAIFTLLPLTFEEILRFDGAEHPRSLNEVLVAGGYPRIFDQNLSPAQWLGSYVSTYVERDVRSLTQVVNLDQFQRFVRLCAGRTAQVINYSSLARDCGITQPTAKSWMGILEASYILFRAPPYFSNLRKRLIKMPKLHFYDSGLVCWLLGIRNPSHIAEHPLRGSIFESWCASEIMKQRANAGELGPIYHYRSQTGAEADLIVETANQQIVVEVKSSQSFANSLASSAFRVKSDLDSSGTKSEVRVIYGGDTSQERSDLTLVAWKDLTTQDWF